MTVAQLIEKLKELPGDAVVVIEKEAQFGTGTYYGESYTISEIYDYNTRVCLEFSERS